MTNTNKPRPKKYDPKLSINGTFEDVIGLSVGKQPVVKKSAKKKKK